MDPNQQPTPQPDQPEQPTPGGATHPPLTPTDTPTPVEPAFGATPTPVESAALTNEAPATLESTPSAPVSAPVTNPVNQPSIAPENPGRTLGIVSFILLFVGMGLVSLILGIVALRKSKRAGHKNGFALAAIILGIVEIIVAFIVSTLLVMAAMTIISTCSELGAGTHTLTSGATISCDEFVTQ